jgi:hypothetical protein
MICYVSASGRLRRPPRRSHAEEIEIDENERGIELVAAWWREVCAHYRQHSSFGNVLIAAEFDRGDLKLVRLRDETVVKLPAQGRGSVETEKQLNTRS